MRPRRRASETPRRRARRAGCPPPTGRARPPAHARPARAPAGEARAGRRRSRRRRGTDGGTRRGRRSQPTRTAPRPARRMLRPPGLPRATRVAGGSMTVSERTSLRVGPLRRAGATTPPYEWPTRWSPDARSSATSAASCSKSTRSTGGFGGNPGRSTRTSSNRSASERCAAHVPLGRRRRSRGRARSAPSGDRNVL